MVVDKVHDEGVSHSPHHLFQVGWGEHLNLDGGRDVHSTSVPTLPQNQPWIAPTTRKCELKYIRLKN